MLDKKVAVIVDGFGPGCFLPAELKKRDLKLIHISSSSGQDSTLAKIFDPQKYDECLVCENIDNTLLKLEKIKHMIVFVLPGSELGVDLADELSERLGLLTNGTHCGRIRRDKYLMHEKLRGENIPSILQMKTASALAAWKWVQEKRLTTFIVKPLDSAGCDGFRICTNYAQLEEAITNIIGKKNILGLLNEECLIQEYIDGIEYVVNGVSYNSFHYITDAWQKKKIITNEGALAYDTVQLISHEELQKTGIIEYLEKVLRALNIRFGPTHAEVKVSSRGPVLIEIAARLSGVFIPEISRLAFGEDIQSEFLLDSYLNPELFLSKTQVSYRPHVDMWVYHAPIKKHGVFDKESFERALPSNVLKHYRIKVAHNQQVTPSKDLQTAAGIFYLLSQDIAALEKERDRLEILLDLSIKNMDKQLVFS